MARTLLSTLLLAIACCALPSVSGKTHARSHAPAVAAPPVRYNATWESLDKRPLPEWFDDAKFGIFIHWGVYSVPAWAPVGEYAEWFWDRQRNVDDGGVTARFQNETYGPNFKYQDFAPMFKAELFNATAWAELFRRAGARYTIPTSKHHEGFALWPSAQAWNWNAVDIGPHRDLLKEIMDATRAAGLHAGAYFSLLEWFHPFILANLTKSTSRRHLYTVEVMRPQWLDLIDNYQPDVLWCDGDWTADSDQWGTKDLLAYVYNDSPVKDRIVVDDRMGTDTSRMHGDFYTPEYSSEVYANKKWEASMGIDVHSYGLNRMTSADEYWSTEYLLNVLVRCVANGGNLLLDIGPNADGTINSLMQERLLGMGAWLDVNGEAIYATRKWRVQQEDGIDNTTIRYTASKDNSVIFALVLQWPDQGLLTVPSPKPGQDATVTMLGSPNELPIKAMPGGVGFTVQLPYPNPSTMMTQYIWTLRMVNFS